MNKLKKISLILFSLLFCFAIYRWVYPNDFFLSSAEYKNHPEYVYHQSPKKFLLADKSHLSAELELFLQHPDSYFVDTQKWLKKNDKRVVSLYEFNEKKYVLKKYNNKHFFDWLFKCPFRSSKAYRSFFYSKELQKTNLPVATPILVLEKRLFFLWIKTYFVSLYLDGQTLEELTDQEKDINFEDINAQVRTIHDFFYKSKLVHRDFVARNLMLSDGKVFVIDLDDVHSYQFKNYFYKKKYKAKHNFSLK